MEMVIEKNRSRRRKICGKFFIWIWL